MTLRKLIVTIETDGEATHVQALDLEWAGKTNGEAIVATRTALNALAHDAEMRAKQEARTHVAEVA